MNENFAALPALFDEAVGEEWMESVVAKVLACINQILPTLLTSPVHHQETTMTTMAFHPNHLARSAPVFRDLRKTEAVVGKVKIVRAWEASSLREIAGTPLRVTKLLELAALQKDHAQLSDKGREKVTKGLKEHFEASTSCWWRRNDQSPSTQ
jgi:hypothetical protein